MAVSLFQRIQAEDFDTWLNPDPSFVAQMMKDQGALAYSLHRNRDDRNAILIHMQFPDEATARAFVAFMESIKDSYVAEHPGAKQEFVEWWVGEDIPSHSSKA